MPPPDMPHHKVTPPHMGVTLRAMLSLAMHPPREVTLRDMHPPRGATHKATPHPHRTLLVITAMGRNPMMHGTVTDSSRVMTSPVRRRWATPAGTIATMPTERRHSAGGPKAMCVLLCDQVYV